MKQLHLKTEDKGPEDSIIVNLKGALLNNANTAKKQSIIKKKKKEGIVTGETSHHLSPQMAVAFLSDLGSKERHFEERQQTIKSVWRERQRLNKKKKGEREEK